MFAYIYAVSKGSRRGCWIWALWELGIQPGSFKRACNAPNCLSMSSSPGFISYAYSINALWSLMTIPWLLNISFNNIGMWPSITTAQESILPCVSTAPKFSPSDYSFSNTLTWQIYENGKSTPFWTPLLNIYSLSWVLFPPLLVSRQFL